MILVRSKLLILALAVSVGSVVSSSVWAYFIGIEAGEKSDAETALFFGILASGTMLALAFLMFSGALKKQRELNTLADLVRHGGDIPHDRLKRFGPLGERIRSILKELSDASDRKGARIASLTGLLRATLDLVDRPILVTTLDGRIEESSRGAKEDKRLVGQNLQAARIEAVLPDIDIRSVLIEADRTHAAVERSGGVSFIPVYSVRGEIGYFIVDISRGGLKDFISRIGKAGTKVSAAREESQTSGTGTPSGFFGFIKKRFAKKPSIANVPARPNPEPETPETPREEPIPPPEDTSQQP